MKTRKSKKGITLIALVITIVVLLILAVVSINLVMNGGVIKHAENAVNQYKIAQTDEQGQITGVEQKIEGIVGVVEGKTLNTNTADFAEALEIDGSQNMSIDPEYITYVSGNSQIKVSMVQGDTFGRFSVIYVTYTDEQGNISEYAITTRNPESSGGIALGQGYAFVPNDAWSKPTGEEWYDEINGIRGENFAHLEADEFPKFEGNWTIDETKSSENGIELLSKVLVDL